MGEQVYSIEGQEVQFSEVEDTYACLCTFPFNDKAFGGKLDADTVRSLALLGAAVCLAHQGELELPILPQGVPEWIRDEIDRVIQWAAAYDAVSYTETGGLDA